MLLSFIANPSCFLLLPGCCLVLIAFQFALLAAACKNKVAAHPAVISVGTSWSEGVLGSNYNTTCIDIWALGFGSLVGAVGADSRNISAYKAVSPR